MKRLMHILLSVTLSVMIIFMGNGLTIVHCKHSGSTKIMCMSDMCKKQCKPTSRCMQYSVLKYSPMALAQSVSLDHTLPIAIPAWLTQPSFEFVNLSLFTSSDLLGDIGIHKHGPPRDYLKLICILLI